MSKSSAKYAEGQGAGTAAAAAGPLPPRQNTDSLANSLPGRQLTDSLGLPGRQTTEELFREQSGHIPELVHVTSAYSLASTCPGGRLPKRGMSVDQEALRRMDTSGTQRTSLTQQNSILSQLHVRALRQGQNPKPNRGEGRLAVTAPPAKSMAAKVDTNAHEKQFTLRQRLHCLVDPGQPQPSQGAAHAATIVAAVTFITILVSVLIFCLESLPENYHGNRGLRATEAACVAIFSLEILAKLIGIEPHIDFWKDGYNYIDIVAVLPFYVELATHGSAVNLVFLRVVRLARVFRMLKLGQYSRPLQMVILVLQNSLDAVGLLVFLLFVCTVLFSSLVWLAEQQNSHFDENERVWIRSDGLASLFQSIPHSTWWCYCTLTTVGYGEVWPMGGWGKLIGAVCMIVGLFVVAFPVILISYHYAELEREVLARKMGVEPGTFCIECMRPMFPDTTGDCAWDSEQLMCPQEPLMSDLLRELTDNTLPQPPEPPKPPEPATEPTAEPSPEPPSDGPSLFAPRIENNTSPTAGKTSPTGSPPAFPRRVRPKSPVKSRDLPPTGSVVCHWRPEGAKSKPSEVYYEGVAAGVPQFKYAPLFCPVLTPSGDLAVESFCVPEQGLRFIRLQVCLDHAVAARKVAQAVAASQLFPDDLRVLEQNCCSRPLQSLSVKIPQLPPTAMLTTSEWQWPDDVISVHIRADDDDTLQRVLSKMTQLTLHFSGSFKETIVQDQERELSVPGFVQERECLEPDIECTVPLMIPRPRRSPPVTTTAPVMTISSGEEF